MSTPLQPCGTPAAYKRHRKHGTPPCKPCKEANRKESAKYRKRTPGPRNGSTLNDLLQEIRFLLNAGEGEHRILQATGYEGRAKTLRSRLTTAGHQTIAHAIFNTWELAA